MSHIVDYFDFEVQTSTKKIAKEIGEHISYQHDEGINPETGCSWYDTGVDCANEIIWEKNKVFVDYDEAIKYLDDNAGWYTQRAVQYKKAKPSKATEKAKQKENEAWKELNETTNKCSAVFNIKSAYLGCKSCGSKMNTSLMAKKNTYRCPICNTDLRSPTALKTIEHKQNKYNELKKRTKELQKKDNEKGKVYWIVRTEYHQ